MKSNTDCVLTINGGSSSIKFSLYQMDERLIQLFYGKIENISTENTTFSSYYSITKQREKVKIGVRNFNSTANFLIDWLQKKDSFNTIKAIGHRIVHGMKHTAPELITPVLLDEIEKNY
ncbi:MAG: hypothetical protein WKF97_14815 [Chitinophagaceae bacterium]